MHSSKQTTKIPAYCLEFVAQMLSCLLLETTLQQHTNTPWFELTRAEIERPEGSAESGYPECGVGLQCDGYRVGIHRIIESEVKRIAYNSGLV